MLEAALARVASQGREVAQLRRENEVLGQAIRALHAEKQALLHRAVAAEAQVAELSAKVGELEQAVIGLAKKKTSANSSQPPSSEGPGERAKRAYPSRERSDKGPGGQDGHEGSGRAWCADPDEVVVHRPARCPAGHDLTGVAGTVTERRQVTDVEVTVTVTEHRKEEVTCPACAARAKGAFPADVTGTACFGPGAKAGVLALSAVGHLPVRVASQMAEALWGLHVAPGAIDTWRAKLALALAPWDDRAVELLRAAPVLGADETPVAVADMKKAYAHVAVTDLLTRFHLADRTKAGIVSGGVLGGHEGTLVTDCLGTYWGIGAAAHQACLAHLARELRFFDEELRPDEEGMPHPHPGFGQLAAGLRAAVHEHNEAARSGAGPPGAGGRPAHLAELVARTRAGFGEHGGRRPATERKALALLNRIGRLCSAGELFGFLDNLAVPPTNNASEQAVRPWKVRQRRSGCFRSAAAAREWLRIAGYPALPGSTGSSPSRPSAWRSSAPRSCPDGPQVRWGPDQLRQHRYAPHRRP